MSEEAHWNSYPSMTPTLPTNSTEFINAFSHYYRGELSRMISWRDRMDRTTNWAIGAAAAMLSVSLSSPTGHPGVLLFAMLLVYLLLLNCHNIIGVRAATTS
jgi:uncharacterized membrane protein